MSKLVFLLISLTAFNALAKEVCLPPGKSDAEAEKFISTTLPGECYRAGEVAAACDQRAATRTKNPSADNPGFYEAAIKTCHADYIKTEPSKETAALLERMKQRCQSRAYKLKSHTSKCVVEAYVWIANLAPTDPED